MNIVNSHKWHWLAAVLAVPAIFSHLGYVPLDMSSDEARRALVALEMDLTGNYLTPTLNGAFYFNKPPLYNWLMVGSFRLWGDYSAWSVRFPMAVSVLGYSITIFLLVRQFCSVQIAAGIALLQLVNGRVLFYESLFGLIDITYSWVTYTALVLVFLFDKRKNYWALYLITYLLTALGFMMKGLPSLVFQGTTLLVWFVHQKKGRLLFHPAHFVGIALFILLIGGYYSLSLFRFGFPVEKAVQVLWQESIKRTGFEFGWEATLRHFLSFPFEFVFHFLPFTLLGGLLYRQNGKRLFRGDSFLTFSAVIFVANLLLYWTSPQVYARYMLMLTPLLFTVLVHQYYAQTSSLPRKWLDGFLGMVMLLTALGIWIALAIPASRRLPFVYLICALTTGGAGVLWLYYRKNPMERLDIFIVFMLVARLSFNFLFIPPRLEKRQSYKDSAEQAAQLTMDSEGQPLPLYSYRKTIGDDGSTDANSFYLSAARRRVLPITSLKMSVALYLADSANLVGEDYHVVGNILLFDQRPALIVKFDSTDAP